MEVVTPDGRIEQGQLWAPGSMVWLLGSTGSSAVLVLQVVPDGLREGEPLQPPLLDG